jgi:hypothetical protein
VTGLTLRSQRRNLVGSSRRGARNPLGRLTTAAAFILNSTVRWRARTLRPVAMPKFLAAFPRSWWWLAKPPDSVTLPRRDLKGRVSRGDGVQSARALPDVFWIRRQRPWPSSELGCRSIVRYPCRADVSDWACGLKQYRGRNDLWAC